MNWVFKDDFNSFKVCLIYSSVVIFLIISSVNFAFSFTFTIAVQKASSGFSLKNKAALLLFSGIAAIICLVVFIISSFVGFNFSQSFSIVKWRLFWSFFKVWRTLTTFGCSWYFSSSCLYICRRNLISLIFTFNFSWYSIALGCIFNSFSLSLTTSDNFLILCCISETYSWLIILLYISCSLILPIKSFNKLISWFMYSLTRTFALLTTTRYFSFKKIFTFERESKAILVWGVKALTVSSVIQTTARSVWLINDSPSSLISGIITFVIKTKALS